jgi:hypothetical protein
LLERDPQAAYRPGQAALGDFIIRAEHSPCRTDPERMEKICPG